MVEQMKALFIVIALISIGFSLGIFFCEIVNTSIPIEIPHGKYVDNPKIVRVPCPVAVSYGTSCYKLSEVNK